MHTPAAVLNLQRIDGNHYFGTYVISVFSLFQGVNDDKGKMGFFGGAVLLVLLVAVYHFTNNIFYMLIVSAIGVFLKEKFIKNTKTSEIDKLQAENNALKAEIEKLKQENQDVK